MKYLNEAIRKISETFLLNLRKICNKLAGDQKAYFLTKCLYFKRFRQKIMFPVFAFYKIRICVGLHLYLIINYNFLLFFFLLSKKKVRILQILSSFLKLAYAIFVSFYIFYINKTHKNYGKCFLFRLK